MNVKVNPIVSFIILSSRGKTPSTRSSILFNNQMYPFFFHLVGMINKWSFCESQLDQSRCESEVIYNFQNFKKKNNKLNEKSMAYKYYPAFTIHTTCKILISIINKTCSPTIRETLMKEPVGCETAVIRDAKLRIVVQLRFFCEKLNKNEVWHLNNVSFR